MAFAMRHPERAAAVVQITPAYNGEARTGNVDDGAWDAMASGLEEGGVDAFVDVAQPGDAAEGWRQIAREAVRQRMERHEHPLEVAKALRQTPRSAAWDGLEALARGPDAGADRGVAATRWTTCTRWRSPRSTRGCCPTPSWWSRTRASRRSHGRAPACRA